MTTLDGLLSHIYPSETCEIRDAPEQVEQGIRLKGYCLKSVILLGVHGWRLSCWFVAGRAAVWLWLRVPLTYNGFWCYTGSTAG